MYERGHSLLLLVYTSSSDYTVQTRAKAQSAEFGQKCNSMYQTALQLVMPLDKTAGPII